MLVKSNTIFAGHLLKLNFWSMQCQMLQAEKCLQKHSSGHHSGFKGTSLPRPSSETLAVSNPLKDICFENLPENLPRSIRDLARDLRPAETLIYTEHRKSSQRVDFCDTKQKIT